MNFLSIFDFIFKKDFGKNLISGLLILVLGGFVFYQFYTIKKIKNKNEQLKEQILIKNIKINNLEVQNKKIQDTVKVKEFENNLSTRKLKLKSKIKKQYSSIIIKKEIKKEIKKNQTKKIKNIKNIENTQIKDLTPGSYIIEIK